jgi:RNA polymerase sigma-70 factor, ECF subfamily
MQKQGSRNVSANRLYCQRAERARDGKRNRAHALFSAENRMNTVESPTDEQLMGQLSAGDEQALADLVCRYQTDVFRFCLHYLKNVELSREIAQETWLRIYTACARFDTSRRFKPWMLCIARNLCLNELKRKKAVHMESLEEYASSAREDNGGLIFSPMDGPAEQLAAQERYQQLMDMLGTLPDEAREIVMLRYFQRLPAREIAEIVDSTEGAVRTRLHRILKQLREEFAPGEE